MAIVVDDDDDNIAEPKEPTAEAGLLIEAGFGLGDCLALLLTRDPSKGR